ncbi:MAG: MFS transporter [Candidatus Methanoperedens sp.]
MTSLGMLVGILNASTLIIALPTMMVKLNTDLFGIMWVLISYTLLLTILAPAWGRLADIHGRKKLYVYGLAVFTIGSLLCGLAANINQLIAFRVLQAVGGSMLVANGTIIVTDAFKRNELGKAMGILSMIKQDLLLAWYHFQCSCALLLLSSVLQHSCAWKNKQPIR